MGTKHIANPGPNVMFVGGKMIPPGEGRDIDEAFLPAELRDAPADVVAEPPSLDDLLAAELKRSVAKITADLPTYKNETLDRMAELENAASTPRKTLLTAIDAERLARAASQVDGQGGGPTKDAFDPIDPAGLVAGGAGDSEGGAPD